MLWQEFNGLGITFVLSLRVAEGSTAIRGSRYEGEAHGNLKRSLAPLGTRHVVSLLAMTFLLSIY